MTRSRPRPSIISALSTLTWTSSPTTTLIGGAPNNPRASTSQPCLARRACLAAASPEKFACVAQVTKPTPQSDGSLSTSSCLLYTSDAADDLLCVDHGG